MTDTPYFKFVYGQRIVDESVPHHFKEIDLETFLPTKPVVLILGGRGTDDNRIANGYAKIVGSLLGVFENDVILLSANYHRGDEIASYAEPNERKLMTQLFLTAVSHDGKKIDVNEACKNLRQFTIFSHCYGERVMSHVTEIFEDELKHIGYSEEEINKILEQLVMISYGTFATNPRIKNINAISPFDESYTSGKHIWRMLLSRLDSDQITPNDKKELLEIAELPDPSRKLKTFYANNHRCYVVRSENNLYLATTQHYQNLEIEHAIKGLSRSEDWQPHKHANVTGDCVSKCLAAALCNSVANSLQNRTSEKHVPFDTDLLQTQLEEIAKQLNEQELSHEPLY